MNVKIAQNLVNKTRQDYNKIAQHFASTRKKGIWPDNLESMALMNLKKGKKVLDVGSGSGRLYPYFENLGIDYTGVDLSEELVKIAKQDYPRGNFIVADATSLPFEDINFDYVISVAVLYHLPSKELRRKALAEIHRVTKTGGETYVSIWYFWNKWKFIKLIVNEGIKKIVGRSELDFGDFFLNWKTPDGKKTTERYCHAWTLWGLKHELKKAGFSDFKVIKGYKDKTRNLNIVCKKI